ncbi:hypothetical protein PPTG_23039 [Phytophthora nicotianae INRA-310]|uniref:Uncharacterized protein n=1 Tax=Phytophthora nicotianae (strain INRA-310) TaxID=761204 RepID=W2Q5U6_PHYN3|nr:hypothetical protein PPTG_23039 [Phytophthora nicotianae INRA-310]ETN08568.1 hypothetical protein PPTG_23039 [Phytophthora nicotianae INRA-310]
MQVKDESKTFHPEEISSMEQDQVVEAFITKESKDAISMARTIGHVRQLLPKVMDPFGKVVPRRQAVQERGARGCPGGRLHPYPKEQPLLSDFFNNKETIKSINSYAAVVYGCLPF